MPAGVHSEARRLRKVRVCRPGLAQKRLTPANCRELLFDDVLRVSRARNDPDAFTSAMIERGVEVLGMHDFLAQTVSDPAARAWLLDRKLGPDFIDPEAAQTLRPGLEALPPVRLAEHLIGALARAELPFEPAGFLARCVGPSDLLLPPLPNTLFTRDSGCWIGGGVMLCPMFWPARRQETRLTAAVYRFHAAFLDASGSPASECWGDPDRDHGLALIEGGDVMSPGEQELANLPPASRTITTLLTRVELDPRDPAFEHPTKRIGPVYTKAESQRIGAARHWPMAPDGTGLRRVVASPQPLPVFGLAAIRWLLECGAVGMAAGGGGIPVARRRDGHGHAQSAVRGMEAVIDKDLCSGLLACELQADGLVIAADVEAVSIDWGKASERAIGKVTPQALMRQSFPAGTMGPKVEAAWRFVLASGHRAGIGSLDEIEALIASDAGTQVCTAAAGGAESL